MKTCFLFPGQGAQYAGMGRDLVERSEGVKELLAEASRHAATDIRALLFDATEEDLKDTERAQLAITAVNLAASRLLRERGIRCDGAAGFSLGEYSALHEAGVFDLAELFRLVRARGDAMADASRRAGPSGMAAVLGLAYDSAVELCRTELRNVWVANYNSPNQIVLSGTADGLAEAETACRARGAKRFIPLKVSGPFHSPLIDGARIEFGKELARVEFRNPAIPVYSNVTGTPIGSGRAARELCLEQIVSTVRWVDAERAIIADGFERCFEVGPGKVLTGLWKSVGESVPCLPAGTWEQIEGEGTT